jgi:hypothetical protein
MNVRLCANFLNHWGRHVQTADIGDTIIIYELKVSTKPEIPGRKVGAAASAGSEGKESDKHIPQRIESANTHVKFVDPII